MTQIPGIYVPISADIKQLKSDMGQAKQIITESANSMTNALNGALSGDQAKKGITSLVNNLSTLSQSSKNAGKDFSQLGVDLKQFHGVTGTSASQFAKLQSQLLQTQAAKAQEKALRDIARQAGLTEKEIQSLGKQFGLSQAQITNVTGATAKTGSAFSGLLGYITPAIAGMIAFQKVVSAVSDEFKFGLKAVEDFGMSVAQSTALITTFSQRAKDGDLAGAFIEANNYAKELVPTLEMIDQKTIASGKDLQVMSETFIANGVLLDINNKKQVEGFTAVANALAIMTQGQNKDIQMRQEIRGLMDGEIRSADKLGMLLKAQIPDIEKQLIKWREQGTVIENLGKLLQGFNATTGLIEYQWATVGSTMETIHTRILRGMMEPVFEDLIQLAKNLNKSLMDAEGNLTPLARGIVKIFNDGYSGAKSFFDENEKGWARMLYDINLVSAGARLMSAALGAGKSFLEDYGSTGLEKAKTDLSEIEQKIKDFSERGDDWWEVSLFKDPAEDKRYLAELTTEAERLRATIADIQNESARELGRSGGSVSKGAPIIAPPAKPEAAASRASDINAAIQAEVEALKAGEGRKLAEIKAANEIEEQANQNAYDLGLKSYSAYLNQKNSLTEESLQSTLDARKKELAAAEGALSKLASITDKEGNARPDKDSKARADAEKKVEDAKRGVIEAEKDLQQAESEGTQQALLAAQERKQMYADTQVQLLESQGKTIEAAVLMAQYDEESLERKRLIAEVEAGTAGAQEALDAKRLMSAQRVKEAELDQLSTKNEALLAIAQIDGEYYKSLDIQTELLDIEIQRAELAGELPEKIALLKREREELEKMKEPLSAFGKGWQDVVRHQKKASEQMHDLASKTATEMQDTFSDVFFSTMKGEFNSIGDAFEAMAGRMLDTFLRLVADIAAQNLMSAVFGGKGTSGSSIDLGGMFNGIGDLLGSGSSDSSWTDGISDWFNSDSSGSSGSSWTDDIDWGDIWDDTEGFAAGGQHRGGLRVVGENGPELEFTGPSTILSNQNSRKWLEQSRSSSAVAPEFLKLVRAMQMAGATAREVSGEIASLAGAHGDNMAATIDNARATAASTKAEKEHTEARTKSTEKSSLTPGSMLVGGIGWGLDKASDALFGALLGPLGPLAKDFALSLTTVDEKLEDFGISLINGAFGFSDAVTDTMASLKESAEGVFGDLGEVGGELGISAEGLSDSASALSDAAKDSLSSSLDSSAALSNAAVGAFGETSLGADMTQASAESLMSSASALSSSASSLGGAAASLGSWSPGMNPDNNAHGFLGDPDIDSRDRQDNSTPGGMFGNDSGFGGYNAGDLSGESTDPGGYYADGGFHRGGWRVVGERGPELEFTPPSMIFSNADTKSILAGQGSQPKEVTTVPLVIQIGNTKVEQFIVRIADGVATLRQRHNIQGRAFI